MGKIYIYFRCSTDGQDFDQQNECVNGYIRRIGISESNISGIVKEKISGTVDHQYRKISFLLDECSDGDTILISELSRLGRNMSDLFFIVTKFCENGVSIIQCKDGSIIENKSIGGKALLFALSLAAEIEVSNLRQRTRMGLDAIRYKINHGIQHISKNGNVVTHLGREKGCDNSKATAASAISKQCKAIEWRQKSIGYNNVIRWIGEGKSDDYIIHEFNAHHISDPNNYSTPSGKPLTVYTLRKWKSEIKNIIL